MGNLNFKAQASLIIRKPADKVFEAFISPEHLSKFWLSSSSGTLSEGETVNWVFKVKGAEAKTRGVRINPNELINWSWDDGSEVVIKLSSLRDGSTVVDVENFGFVGSEEEKLATTIDSTQGFAFVLCALKAYLENGSELGIMSDKSELNEMRCGT